MIMNMCKKIKSFFKNLFNKKKFFTLEELEMVEFRKPFFTLEELEMVCYKDETIDTSVKKPSKNNAKKRVKKG